MNTRLKESEDLQPHEIEQRAKDILDKLAPYSINCALGPSLHEGLKSGWMLLDYLEEHAPAKGMQANRHAQARFASEVRGLYHRWLEEEILNPVLIQVVWDPDPQVPMISYVVRFNEVNSPDRTFSKEIRIPAFRPRSS